MAKFRMTLSLVAALVALPALAQRVGSGSGKSSVTAPPTKDVGVAPERAEEPGADPLLDPSHGLLGAPGAALDAAGPSRLGAPSERLSRSAETPRTWKSGDLVRSWTSADVRAARQQAAPDLQWAASRSPSAPPEPRRPNAAKRAAGGKR